MKEESRFAKKENHWFLGIGKLEFEIDSTGFNSTCLQIKAWNCDNESKQPNIIITFDSAEYGNITMKDITEPRECTIYHIKSLIEVLGKKE